jgi:hypothetical protein
MLEFRRPPVRGWSKTDGEDSNGYPAIPYRLVLAGART